MQQNEERTDLNSPTEDKTGRPLCADEGTREVSLTQKVSSVNQQSQHEALLMKYRRKFNNLRFMRNQKQVIRKGVANSNEVNNLKQRPMFRYSSALDQQVQQTPKAEIRKSRGSFLLMNPKQSQLFDLRTQSKGPPSMSSRSIREDVSQNSSQRKSNNPNEATLKIRRLSFISSVKKSDTDWHQDFLPPSAWDISDLSPTFKNKSMKTFFDSRMSSRLYYLRSGDSESQLSQDSKRENQKARFQQAWEFFISFMCMVSTPHYAYIAAFGNLMSTEQKDIFYFTNYAYIWIFSLDFIWTVANQLFRFVKSSQHQSDLLSQIPILKVCIDVITLLPLAELLQLFAEARVADVLYLIKTLRLARASLVQKWLEHGLREQIIKRLPFRWKLPAKFAWKVLSALLWTLFLCFYAGICWYILISFLEDEERPNFINSIEDLSHGERMIAVEYFFVTTVTTVGLGDFHPVICSERAVWVVLMIFCLCLMMNYFLQITRFCALCAEAREKNSAMADIEMLLQRLNGGHSVHPNILAQVRQSLDLQSRYKLFWIERGESYLQYCPRLRLQLWIENHSSFSSKFIHLFFPGQNPSLSSAWRIGENYQIFLATFLSSLEPIRVEAGELIQKIDDTKIFEVYFIMEGEAEAGFGADFRPNSARGSSKGPAIMAHKDMDKLSYQISVNSPSHIAEVKYAAKMGPGCPIGLYEKVFDRPSQFGYRVKPREDQKELEWLYIRHTKMVPILKQFLQNPALQWKDRRQIENMRANILLRYFTCIYKPLKQAQGEHGGKKRKSNNRLVVLLEDEDQFEERLEYNKRTMRGLDQISDLLDSELVEPTVNMKAKIALIKSGYFQEKPKISSTRHMTARALKQSISEKLTHFHSLCLDILKESHDTRKECSEQINDHGQQEVHTLFEKQEEIVKLKSLLAKQKKRAERLLGELKESKKKMNELKIEHENSMLVLHSERDRNVMLQSKLSEAQTQLLLLRTSLHAQHTLKVPTGPLQHDGTLISAKEQLIRNRTQQSKEAADPKSGNEMTRFDSPEWLKEPIQPSLRAGTSNLSSQMQGPSSLNQPTTTQGDNADLSSCLRGGNPDGGDRVRGAEPLMASKNNFGFYDVFIGTDIPQINNDGKSSAQFNEETKQDWTGEAPDDSDDYDSQDEDLGLSSPKKSYEPVVGGQAMSKVMATEDEESRILIKNDSDQLCVEDSEDDKGLSVVESQPSNSQVTDSKEYFTLVAKAVKKQITSQTTGKSAKEVPLTVPKKDTVIRQLIDKDSNEIVKIMPSLQPDQVDHIQSSIQQSDTFWQMEEPDILKNLNIKLIDDQPEAPDDQKNADINSQASEHPSSCDSYPEEVKEIDIEHVGHSAEQQYNEDLIRPMPQKEVLPGGLFAKIEQLPLHRNLSERAGMHEDCETPKVVQDMEEQQRRQEQIFALQQQQQQYLDNQNLLLVHQGTYQREILRTQNSIPESISATDKQPIQYQESISQQSIREDIKVEDRLSQSEEEGCQSSSIDKEEHRKLKPGDSKETILSRQSVASSSRAISDRPTIQKGKKSQFFVDEQASLQQSSIEENIEIQS